MIRHTFTDEQSSAIAEAENNNGFTIITWKDGRQDRYDDPDGEGWAAIDNAVEDGTSVGAAVNRHVRPLPSERL